MVEILPIYGYIGIGLWPWVYHILPLISIVGITGLFHLSIHSTYLITTYDKYDEFTMDRY